MGVSAVNSTGAPVSILIDYGLAEATVDALVRGDIGTVEKLGSMTPELLEALEGIDENDVSLIQQAINSYYGQEYAEEAPAAAQEPAEPAAAEVSTEATADVTDSAGAAEPEASGTMSESVEAGAPTDSGGETVSQSEK